MQIEQAIKLINYPGLSSKSPMDWADLGSGEGFFTLVLGSLLMPGSKIVAVDKQFSLLQKIKDLPGIQIKKIQADFLTDDLMIGEVDGLLMANAFHFVPDKISFLKKISVHLKEKAVILIIEYDRDSPNRWIPYPVSFESLGTLINQCFGKTVRKLYEIPSLYNGSMIYSAWIELDSPKPWS